MARIPFAALGAALLIASTAGAQGSHEGHKQGRGQGSGEARGVRGARGEMALFRGITLTETQKTQIQQIRARYHDQFKAQRDSMRPERGARGEGQRQRPDSAQRAQRRAQAEAVMAQNRVIRERELAEMRAVLTPEQRVTFDANVAQFQARMEKRGDDNRREKVRGEKGRGQNKGPRAGKSGR